MNIHHKKIPRLDTLIIVRHLLYGLMLVAGLSVSVVHTANADQAPPPIFKGKSPPNFNPDNPDDPSRFSKATLIFPKKLFEDPQGNKFFYWQSDDSVIGPVNATIDTAPAVGMRWYFMEGKPNKDGMKGRPARLVFTGSGDGAIFYGNVLFANHNRAVVDVIKDGKRIRYLLKVNIPSPHRGCCVCTGAQCKMNPEFGETTITETVMSYKERSSSSINTDIILNFRSLVRTSGPQGVRWDHNHNERFDEQIDGSMVHFDGLGRQDRYCPSDTAGDFISPPEFFTRLKSGSLSLRDPDGTVKIFDSEGKILEKRDRNNNFITYQYNGLNQLDFIEDTLGRRINFIHNASGQLIEIVDYDNRKISYEYDSNRDLVAVTTPPVVGTLNGNDYPNGKTTQYTYSSGFSDEALNHNLLTITRPNEVANGGPPSLIIEYGTDPSRFDFGKVIKQTYGGTNTSGTPAGGVYTFQYTQLLTGTPSGDPNEPFSRMTETDPNGNITEYEYNALGYPVVQREFTNRNIRPGDPEFFETRYNYNADGRLLETILPQGNKSNSVYDENNADRFAQGNQTSTQRLPDARGGDQTSINSQSVYEPVYQQVASSIDPRGLDPAFTPPIGDPSGRTQAERYTTRYFFDYQEADAAITLPLLAAELGISEAEMQTRLNAADIQLGLEDLNGDGLTPVRVAGNVVRMEAPPAVLLAGSNQAVIEGDQLQNIITQYGYNDFGQKITMIDPEGNVHLYTYHRENDPDGDNETSPGTRPGLNTETGGYLKETISDTQAGPDRNNKTNPAPVNIRMSYLYDPVGNEISMTDGRGIRTDYEVNQLNQVVRTIRAAAVPPVGVDEPLSLTAFNYIEDTFYDENDNVIKNTVEDRGDTSNTGGFVETTFLFDILDQKVQQNQEVDVNETLETLYRYDANRNQTLMIQPVGNAVSSLYDERDLLFQTTTGALTATPGTLGAPPGPYNPRGGVPSTVTSNYDLNQNLIEQVDADDTDGSGSNNSSIAGFGDRTRFEFDGFDRSIRMIDSVGNEVLSKYDPVSNVVRQTRNGPVRGSSPTNDNGVGNVLLSLTDFVHDELNRIVQQDQSLFVSSGVNTQRLPNISDAGLTPGDDKVSMRYEYDRKSRQTFMIQDDLDTRRIDYDGVDRTLKSTDPEGNLMEYAYDDNNNVIETRTTDLSQIGSIANEIFLTTSFYDSLNRVQRQVDNIGQTMEYRYDSRNNMVAMADAEGPLNGAITRRTFPNGPLTVNTINNFGNVTQYFFDGINRQLSAERVLTASGKGDGVNIGADLFGVKAATPPPDPNQSDDGLITTSNDWDKNSLLTSLSDDLGFQTQYTYDNLNRRLTETKGLCTEPVDPTQYRCDPPTTIEWQYDPDHNVVKITYETGSVADLNYDAINRRINNAVTRAAGVIGTTLEVFRYDGLSRLTLARDNNDPVDNADNSLITYTYDSLSRVIEECQKLEATASDDCIATGGKIISSGWLAENLRIETIYPNDRVIEHDFDMLDRLENVRDQGAGIGMEIGVYDYIGVGRVLERNYPINGTRQTYLNDAGNVDTGYDGLRRIVQLRQLRSDNSLIVGFEHGYDQMNNKLFEKKLHDPGNGMPGNNELYDYDSVYRLLDFERGTLNAGMDEIIAPTLTMDTTTGEGAIQQQEWTLDGLGNWRNNDITTKNGAVPEIRRHSSFNELIHTADGTPIDLNHDDNGNLIVDDRFDYEWDYRNRLRKVTRKSDSALIAVYQYDAANRRNRKTVTNSAALNGVTDFYYDGWRVVEERDGVDDLEQQYVYGIYIDEALVLDRNLDGDDSAVGGSDQRLFYHQNTLYSVFALTDVNAVIVEGYQYDAYGKQTVFEPGGNGMVDFGGDDVITVGGLGALDNPYLYTGRRLDGESGLYYYRNRYYSVEQGRFLARDPLDFVDGMNLYEYGASMPTKFTDAWGLFCCVKDIKIVKAGKYDRPLKKGQTAIYPAPNGNVGPAFNNPSSTKPTTYMIGYYLKIEVTLSKKAKATDCQFLRTWKIQTLVISGKSVVVGKKKCCVEIPRFKRIKGQKIYIYDSPGVERSPVKAKSIKGTRDWILYIIDRTGTYKPPARLYYRQEFNIDSKNNKNDVVEVKKILHTP